MQPWTSPRLDSPPIPAGSQPAAHFSSSSSHQTGNHTTTFWCPVCWSSVPPGTPLWHACQHPLQFPGLAHSFSLPFPLKKGCRVGVPSSPLWPALHLHPSATVGTGAMDPNSLSCQPWPATTDRSEHRSAEAPLGHCPPSQAGACEGARQSHACVPRSYPLKQGHGCHSLPASLTSGRAAPRQPAGAYPRPGRVSSIPTSSCPPVSCVGGLNQPCLAPPFMTQPCQQQLQDSLPPGTKGNVHATLRGGPYISDPVAALGEPPGATHLLSAPLQQSLQ